MTKRLQVSILFILFGVFCFIVGYRIDNYSKFTEGPEARPLEFDGSGEFYQFGKLALQKGHYSNAIPFLEKAKLLEPASIPITYTLAEAYRKKGMAEKAIAAFEEVLELDSAQNDSLSLFALETLAKLYGKSDRLQESRLAYEQALGRETREKQIQFIKNQLAELDLTEGKYEDDGNTIYNEKEEVIGGVGPGDMRTNQDFEIARHTSDWKKKEVFFKKAIETDPGMHQAYFNAGLALTKQGKFQEAISYFQKSNEVWKSRKDVNPNGEEKSSAFTYLGLCHYELGQLAKALSFCNRAIELDSSNYYAHLFKAKILIKLSRTKEAISILRTLLETNPDDSDVFDFLSEIQKPTKPSCI